MENAKGFTRRWFIGGCATLGATAGCALPGFSGGERPIAKFGVLSDVHLQNGDERFGSDSLVKAFRHFRDSGVDGVLLAGDMADRGRVSQLQICADAWFSVFPDGKAPDGRKVEQLFVYGNHDVDGWCWGVPEAERKNPELLADAIGLSEETRAAAWKKCFREDYSPIWIKNVKGIRVIGAHWKNGEHTDIEEFMSARKNELDPSLPFIYVQHAHPKNTCFGEWAWGHDDGTSTRVLSAYPNAISFSGHSHYSLTDERTVWQGAFTSINTGSMRYASIDYAMRENTYGNGSGYRGGKGERAMSNIDTWNSRHAMVLSVYRDRIVLERRDFASDGLSLGDDWIVPVPARGDGSFAYGKRAAKRAAPEFAPSAAVSVEEKTGDDGKRRIWLSFPAARTVDGCRVNEYEITATLAEDDFDLVQSQKRVMANGFNLPEELSDVPGSCAFFADDLPKGRYVFSVRPIECFGKKGRALQSGVVKVS